MAGWLWYVVAFKVGVVTGYLLAVGIRWRARRRVDRLFPDGRVEDL